MARLKDRPDVEFFASLAAVARLADQRLERAAQVALRPRLDALRTAFEPAAFEAALPFLRRLRAWLEADG